MNKNNENSKTKQMQGNLPYTHCLNCGAELQGMFCHICGQEATSKTPTVIAFILEYMNNAFIWDSKFFKTLWTLISHPGRLTKEYNQGKFVSQEHPLKLNMFLLFVFISLFVLFSDGDKMTNSLRDLATDERILPSIQMEFIIDEEEYIQKFNESPRDTVQLMAPLLLAEKYAEHFVNLDTIEDTKGEGVDKWVAVIPHTLIEEDIVTADRDGYYRFNPESNIGKENVFIMLSLLEKLLELISNYFPMLVLFTAPILSMALSIVQRKSRLPRINHFIFALHYTALLEVLMISLYVAHFVSNPSIQVLNTVMLVGSCTYLTVAFRKVYETRTWFTAALKALFTSLLYSIIGFMIFIGIFITAVILVVSMLE